MIRMPFFGTGSVGMVLSGVRSSLKSAIKGGGVLTLKENWDTNTVISTLLEVNSRLVGPEITSILKSELGLGYLRLEGGGYSRWYKLGRFLNTNTGKMDVWSYMIEDMGICKTKLNLRRSQNLRYEGEERGYPPEEE